MLTSTLTLVEREKLVRAGAQLYESLRPKLESNHRGKYVAISVKTGKHVVSDDDEVLRNFKNSLDPNDFFWMARIGDPNEMASQL